MTASPAAGCGCTRPARAPASRRADRGTARRSRWPHRPRSFSLRLRRCVMDVEGAAVGWDLDRRRARHSEAEPVDVATLLDVAQLVRIVVRREDLVLGTDDEHAERWRH